MLNFMKYEFYSKRREKPIPTKYWAGGFLYNPEANAIFLHKRDANTPYNPNKWAFFGGLNEGDETPSQCYMRELKEEIGLNLDEKNVFLLCEYFNTELSTYRIVFYSISNVQACELALTEGFGFGWIQIDSLEKYDLTEKTKKDLDLFKVITYTQTQ